MLETIDLPGARTTTRLGFGCSGLMGGLSERQSLRLLGTAFDNGVRHFDVAPSYGHGIAERCLGKFLRGKADRVTVTTKYGILPPAQAGLLDVARMVVRPFAAQLPALRRRVGHAAAQFKSAAQFSAAEARQSLDRSLSHLGVDHIDLFLLHDATAEDLRDSDLLEFLEQSRSAGKIAAYGVGTERRNLKSLLERHPRYCHVLQFECSVLDPKPIYPGAFTIHHRAVSGALTLLRHKFQLDTATCRRWSNSINADLADDRLLAAILLRAALVSNLNGMVLFSSRISAHIETNLHVAENPTWTNRAIRLLELITSEHLRQEF